MYPNKIEQQIVFEVMASSGASIEDLIKCALQDYDDTKGMLRISTVKGRRKVVLTKRASKIMNEYLGNYRTRLLGTTKSDLLFLSSRGGEIRQRTLQSALSKIAFNLGYDPITPSTIINSVVSYLLQNNINTKTIINLLDIPPNNLLTLINLLPEPKNEEEMEQINLLIVEFDIVSPDFGKIQDQLDDSWI
ncbi:MAG: tyrosine-type recombinase/integrase [Candidatus Heimdallarchaeota archaeon]|nr:tyrosine-type recombinase/integrase [Candidatus Heimdallarchaeota archaeon]